MIFTLKWLYPYWKRHSLRMVSIVVFGMSSAVLQAVNPVLIKNIVNGLGANLNTEYIRDNVLLILLVGAGLYVTNMLAQRNRARMNLRLEWEFRKNAFEHIIGLDASFFHRHSTGDLVTRLVDDISEKISWFSCSGVFRFIQSALTIIAVICVMLYLNPALTFWVLLPAPLIVIFSIRSGKLLTRRYDALQSSISALYDFLETCFTGIRLIKANAKEEAQRAFFSVKADVQKRAEIAAARQHLLFMFFFRSAGFLAVVLLYLAGGLMVMDGRTSLGHLIAFQFYAAMIVMPIADISNFFVRGNQARVSIRRIEELLSAKSRLKPARGEENPGPVRELEFRGVALKAPVDSFHV